MAIDKITLDATKCILAARLRGCNAPFWRIQCGVSFPTEPATIPILSSFRRRPESRATPTIPTHAPSVAARLVSHHTPHWVPACAGTTARGHRSSPVAPHPFVIPAKAGIQNPRSPVQLTPRAPLHLRCLITRRTGYRPAPVRRAGRLVPLRRCLAGMTGWSAGTPFSFALPA